MDYTIKLPKEVYKIFSVIEEYGSEAYVVGGCVRDSILGRDIHDWDICTPVIVSELIPLFEEKGYYVIPTGLQHGTITVMINGVGYEITTFRRDSDYEDHRHPNNVEFTSSLIEDLSRRDFTMNAIAYNPTVGIVDPFHGLDDINNRVIRCVGNPVDRFSEDALRILRAIRFACQLDFSIDPAIGWVIGYTDIKETLKYVSAERIQSELLKMIVCDSFANRLLWHHSVFEEFIPEFKDMFIPQNNPYHIYNIAQHTGKVIGSIDEDDIILKLAALFHDIGKPYCYQDGEDGIRHFKGHGKVSADMTNNIMRRIRFDNDTREAVVQLVYYHDATFEVGEKYVKRWLNKIGEKQFKRLLKLRKADIMGQNPEYVSNRLDKIEKIKHILSNVLETGECFSIKDLAFNGDDVMKLLSIEPGKQVGMILNFVLNEVMDSKLSNTKNDIEKWIISNFDGE